MFWRLIALALALGLFARADVDPCKRQPFRGRCPSVNGAPLMRSQFVLRYYLRESECVSYPYGHCANDENEPKLFRYKEECEDACTKKASDEIKDNVIENQETPAALEVDSEVTEATTEAAEVTAEQTYGTASAPVDSTTNSGYKMPKTECQRQHDSRGQGLIKGGFVPECTKNGEFKQLQCEQDKSECFCVNSEGIEIDNSRTKGEKPDCGQIIVATPQRTNDCVGKSEFGPCKSQIPRWFYDESSQICRQFVYSGCGGSGNNYPTEAACQKRCVPTKEAGKCHHGVEPLKTAQGRTVNCAKTDCPPGYKCSVIQQNSVCCPDIEKTPNLGNLVTANACDQPKERGPCDRYELRFYFNKELKECKYFFFGGCEGNDNNFARVEDCEKTCGAVKSNHELPSTEPTTTPSTTTPKPTSPTTERPKISLGPRIHLPVEIEPQTLPTTTPDLPIDRCLHPKDGGNCGGQFVRWLWNNNQRKCEPFTYTGCGGNGNNFATQEECLSICHIEVVKSEPVPDVVNVCDAEADVGECTGSFMRYAFDRIKGDCRQFQYGGCGGNGNNFATVNDCRRKCIPSKGPEIPLLQQTTTASTVLNTSLVVTPSLNVCAHPIEIGECSGVFQRFAYDGDTNECRSFEYGGCGGNGNNFATLEECRSACIRVRCPPTPSCDTSRCQIVGDNRGCPFCSCPPPSIHPPLAPSIETRPQCPFLDVNMCVEPCIIFRNRHGCEECVCPVMPSQLPPRVLPTVPQPPPRPFSQPSPEVDLPPPSRPAPAAPSHAPSPPAPPSPPATRITRPPLPGVPIVTVAPLPVPVAPSHQIGLGEKCTQPVDPGPCKNFVERWHFNDQRGECEPFHYGGCAGNRNHFFSRRECEIHCARFSRVSHSHVEEPVQPQPIFESRPPPPPSTSGVPVLQTRPPQVIETRSPPPSPHLKTRPPFVPVFETRPPPVRFETRPSLSPPTRPPLQSTVTISKEIEPSLSRQSVFPSTFAPPLPSPRVFSLPAQRPIHTVSFPPAFRPSTVWSTFAPAPIQKASQPPELIPSSTASVIQTSQRPSRISSPQTQIPVEDRPASDIFPPIAPSRQQPVQPLRIPILPQQPALFSTLPPSLSFSTISTHIFKPITFAALPPPQLPVEKPVPLQPIAQQPHFRQLPPQLPPKLLPNQPKKQFAQPIFDKTAFDKQSSVSAYQPPNPPIRPDYQPPQQPENINNQYIPPQPPVVPGITPAPVHPVVPNPTDLWPANVVKPKGGSYGMEEIKNTGQGLIKIQSLPKPTDAPVFETVAEATTELVTEAPKTDASTVPATEATTTTETQPSSTEAVTIAASTAVPVSSSEASLVTTASVVASTVSNTVPDSSLPHSGSGYGEEPAAGYGSATLPKESVEEIKPPIVIEDKVPSTEIGQKNLSINSEAVITPKPQSSGAGEYRVFGGKSNIQAPIDPPGNVKSSIISAKPSVSFSAIELIDGGNSRPIGRQPIKLNMDSVEESVDRQVVIGEISSGETNIKPLAITSISIVESSTIQQVQETTKSEAIQKSVSSSTPKLHQVFITKASSLSTEIPESARKNPTTTPSSPIVELRTNSPTVSTSSVELTASEISKTTKVPNEKIEKTTKSAVPLIQTVPVVGLTTVKKNPEVNIQTSSPTQTPPELVETTTLSIEIVPKRIQTTLFPIFSTTEFVAEFVAENLPTKKSSPNLPIVSKLGSSIKKIPEIVPVTVSSFKTTPETTSTPVENRQKLPENSSPSAKLPEDELQPEQTTTPRAAIPTQTSAKTVPPTTTIAVPQPTQPALAFTPRPLAPRPTIEVFGPPQLPRTFENEICVLPPDSGNCTSYIPRFFYNAERGICHEFSYGSCGGNANNFLDKFSCEAKCGLPAIVAALPLRCQLPKQEGFGQGYFPKWYFNVKNLRCERLVYKGNNGNENQFESQQDCEQICQAKQIAPTAPPRETLPPRNPNKPEKKPLGSVLGVPNAAATNGAFEELPAAPVPYEPAVLPPATSAPQPPAEAPAPAPNPEAPAPVSGTNALEPPPSNAAVESSSSSNYDARPAEEQMIPHPDMKLPPLGPSPPGGIDYSSGRPKASGLPNRPVGDKDSEGVIDPNEGQPILLPPDDGLVSIVEEEKPEKNERPHIPLCPNEQDALRYENNETVMCLPGKNNCPENSVCYFNGMDFYCCPNAEDPYDMHVFGGYDGEEEKHGYKSVPTHLNIRSLRARRQASLPLTAFSIDHITKPLRFDDKPITQISRAGNIDKLAHLRVNPCTQIVDKGECREAHLRFFYDIKVDSCRLFYYSGCDGNANNFATQKECENRCKLGIVITTTTQEPRVPPGRCPGGKIPLGENAPVLCGNQTDSIDCPSGYYCRQGPPDVCCPDEPLNLQTILAASSNREIRRKPFINAAGKFDGGHDHHHHHEEHAHAHGVATEHGPEGGYNSENADVAANAESIDASPAAETQHGATETHSEAASVVESAPVAKSASSSAAIASTPNPISIPLPENMCPDGSDALVEADGKAKTCGAGFDGHAFCPKGYYCSIDLERNSRLCCPLTIQGSNIPPPPVDAPYFGHRRFNPGEVVERGSLPSDPKPPKLSTPKPKTKSNSGDIENSGVVQTEGESVAKFENAGISGGNAEAAGSQQVAPAAIPESGHEKPYAHLMMKPVDPASKLRKVVQAAVNSTRGIDEGHIRLSSVEDPFELDEKSRPRSKSPLDKSICQLKPTEGRVCREDEPSPITNLQYYYSVIDKKCKLFFHHGCGGNLNRFDSKTACERFCIVQQ